MKKNVKFYICEKCGNIIGLINGNLEYMQCCGNEFKELQANVTDASPEKHIPVYEKIGNELIVKVGSVEHPMEDEHYIMWIAMVSENETTRKALKPNQTIDVKFNYIPNSTIYAYCNKHGLWKIDVE